MVFWSVENRWWALLLLVILQFSSLVFFVANNSIKFSLPQKFTEDIWTKASIFAQPLPLPRPTLTCLKHVRPSPLDVSNLMVRFFCQLDRVSWVRRLLNQYGTFLRLQGGLVVPRLFWDRVFLGWLMECILRWVQEECYYDKLLRSLHVCVYFLTEREELNIGDWCSAILYILQLITRPDIKIFLPPIGGLTIYIWGDPDTIPDEDIELTCRVHDECNGSDVFGSDICTCRPYLTHAIEECIKTARKWINTCSRQDLSLLFNRTWPCACWMFHSNDRERRCWFSDILP